MFEKFTSPMIFGHRGACAIAPENTIPSFELACEQGADAIELDVKLTSDQEAVVIHDQTVNRTTGGDGKVNQHTLADIKKLDAGIFKGEQYKGVQIPTLDEVFESMGKRILINVELTNYFSPQDKLIPIVAEIVKRHHLENDIFFSSFKSVNLDRMQQLLPETPVALLCSIGLLGVFARSSLYLKTSPSLIHPYLSDVDDQFVLREHQRGRRVHVWTVNQDADILRLAEIGVDGIFTDHPLRALRLLGRK